MTRQLSSAIIPIVTVFRLLRLIAAGLFILALPVFLVASNVRLVANAPAFYQWSFARQGVAATTGLSPADLDRVGQKIISYFNSAEEDLLIRVTLGGQERDLFNPREVLHMRDVKGLIQGVVRVQDVTLITVAGVIALGLAWRRKAFLPSLARLLRWGSALIIAALVALMVGVWLGFDQLFLWFHLLSFSNLFWMLDPRTDYLIRFFPPPGFYIEATLLVAGATMLEAAVLAGLSWLWLRKE